MTDKELSDLEAEWRKLLNNCAQIRENLDGLVAQWAKLNTQRDQELARRKMRAQVLAEIEAEKQQQQGAA